MKAAIIVFPGSNCDRDMAVAFRRIGADVSMVWHKDAALPDVDVVALPGGFSFGDYLRCGAIAARSPIMRSVVEFAGKGGYVLGVCNGFQVLTETGLLPGALMRNAALKFVCRDVWLKVETSESAFTSAYQTGEVMRVPVAHHEGNYIADGEAMLKLNGEGRVAFRYATDQGDVTTSANPNGAMENIAGVLSENRRVLGMMPHPERANDPELGGVDGARLFDGLLGAMAI